MNVLDDNLYLELLEKVLKENNDIVTEFAGKKILITGASGLIGSAVVDLLITANKKLQNKIVICAAGRDTKKLVERFGIHDSQLQYVEYDATKRNLFCDKVDYIVHAAGNASPDLYVSKPVDTMLANFYGIHQLLEYSVEKQVNKILYVSSSEVYGKHEKNTPYNESEYGYVDILNTRSSYAASKRASETLCISYASEYGVNAVIVRPGHIYGPTAKDSDNRVAMDLMREASKGNTLVLRSEGSQIRSYCHCLDCASAILTVLVRGEKGEAYNISNVASVISVREMAEKIAQTAGVELQFQIPKADEAFAQNPMRNSSLNSQKLESLGWRGCFDINDGIVSTMKILKSKCLK